MKTESSTKERILNTAVDLFYSKGYVNTGVEEIIVASNCKKPTLYYYFKSKSDLGIAYLDFKEAEFLSVLDRLSERTETLQDFFHAWTNLVKRGAKERKFHGCPFTSFAAQMNNEERPIFEEKLHFIKKKWLKKVGSIMENKSSKKRNFSTIDFSEKALGAMVIYVGGSNLYRMTGQIEFLDAMGKQFQQIANEIK
jgi:AcrR family transcriptional regulator